MPKKRGRPVLADTDDPAILRRRQRDAERARQYRERRLTAANTLPTPQQLQQAEVIIEHTFEELEVAQTLQNLGLRVGNITLAQDAYNTELRQETVHINDQAILYSEEHQSSEGSQPIIISVDDNSLTYTPILRSQTPLTHTPSLQAPSRPRGQHTITHFFQSNPTTNPFSTRLNLDTSIDNTYTGSQDGQEGVSGGYANQATAEDGPNLIPSVIDGHPQVDRSDQPPEQIPTSIYSSSRVENTPAYSSGPLSDSDWVTVSERLEDEGESREDEEDEEGEEGKEGGEGEGDEGDIEEEVPADVYTIQKLYEQLQGGFHGCPIEQHQENLDRHTVGVEDSHCGLDGISNDSTFPSVLRLSEMITPDRLARQHNPTPAQWKAMFCGIPLRYDQPNPQPTHACLYREETEEMAPLVAFDVDSFLGFASSLGMARQGVFYSPAPQVKENIKTDVHLETTLFHESHNPEQPAHAARAMLQEVPHLLLGRVVGASDITIHILFPRLAFAGRKFVSMTDEQLSRWLDQVFHPAVYHAFTADYTQHLPASYRTAKANSRAYQVERRQVETASYRSRLSLGYHLQPEYLNRIWAEILEIIISTPGLTDFQDAQIFFSAKNTKLQFKTSPSRPTMLDAMENFTVYLERVVDLDCVYQDRLYVDVGKEICPPASHLRSEGQGFDGEAQVYSWKRCCLKHYVHWIYDGQAPAEGSAGQRYYCQNMLYEACSMTSTTPRRSKLRQGGLIYSQFYASVKELSDAAQCKPFNHDGLEELALDPQIRQSAKDIAGGRRRDAKVIETAYLEGKRRARYALIDSKYKSFGIREEHRVSWQLLQGLIARLQVEEPDSLRVVLYSCPTYVWAVKTDTYLGYLWRSVDKFATGFEVVHASCQQGIVTWEQTKMMAMFLRCLRFVFGAHQFQRESALWWSKRERAVARAGEQRVWYGLGFKNTLSKYNHCWLEPRFNWSRLAFRSDVTDNILFGNDILRGQYLRRGGRVRDFFNTTQQMDLALEWIEKYRGKGRILGRLLEWMSHICLLQFRVDVLESVRHEIKEEYREAAVQGRVPFCHEYFAEIMSSTPHLMSGNKCAFKHPVDVGNYLLNYDDGQIREHWEGKGFRTLYRRGLVGLGMRHGGRRLASSFKSLIQRVLFTHHWILPYPCSVGLLQKGKHGIGRMWYSIDTTSQHVVELEFTEPMGWKWSRKGWRAGTPADFPEFLGWEKQDWVDWIGEQERERERERSRGIILMVH